MSSQPGLQRVHPQSCFGCTICRMPLFERGPQISDLSFGRLFSECDKTAEQMEILFQEFPGYLEAIQNRSRPGTETVRVIYDCNKILATPCGHLFHSGCLREWFFIHRNNANKSCPFCNQQTNLQQCILIYPDIAETVDSPSTSSTTTNLGQHRTRNSKQTNTERPCVTEFQTQTEEMSTPRQLGESGVQIRSYPYLFPTRARTSTAYRGSTCTGQIQAPAPAPTSVCKPMTRGKSVPKSEEGSVLGDFLRAFTFFGSVMIFWMDYIHNRASLGETSDEDEDYVEWENEFVIFGYDWIMVVILSFAMLFMYHISTWPEAQAENNEN